MATPRFPVAAVGADFKKNLLRERKARRWSQARLASKAGLSRGTITRLERGERLPLAETVFRLEAALDLQPSTLVPAWPEWAPIGSKAIGASARRRRKELGLTLDEVAIKAGISPATLSRFEREETTTPSLVLNERTAFGGQFTSLHSKGLAKALGFKTIAAFTSWIDR